MEEIHNYIDYIMTKNPGMITEKSLLNRFKIGSDHIMVIRSIRLQDKKAKK